MVADCARRGLKREYAFASAQADATPPPARARARAQNWSNPFLGNDESMGLENKRTKKSVKKNTTNGRVGKHSIPDRFIVDGAPAPEGEIDLNAEFVSPAEKDSTFPATEGLVLTGEVVRSAEGNGHPKIDVRDKPKIKAPNLSELKKSRLKLKDLMKSGLLEGLPVKYIKGPKTKGPSENSLKGTINGSGILCSCDICGGKEVVSPNVFEVHAGSGNKRPADYIYLENGNNLREVLNVCIDTPLEGLELAVQNLISCASEKKEPISEDPVCTSPAFMEDSAIVPSRSSAIVPSRSLKESENNYYPAIKGENSECNSPRILVKSQSSGGVITGPEKETTFTPRILEKSESSAGVITGSEKETTFTPRILEKSESSAGVITGSEKETTFTPRILEKSESSSGVIAGSEKETTFTPRILEKSESSAGVIIGSEKETSLQEAVPPSSFSQKSSKSKTQGKLTKKDIRLHRLVFTENAIIDGTPVDYIARKQVALTGYKMGTGIICKCCNIVMSPSQFEAHAGWASRRKPYLHIFAMGLSLHELAMTLSKRVKVSDEDKDSICSVCGDEDGDGDLISCSSCPRVSHAACVPPLPANPENVYSCRYCRNNSQIEKNGNRNVNALEKAPKRAAKRCSQILKVRPEAGGCILCRDPKFTNSGFGPKTVMICDQCEKEYHVGCLKKYKMDDLKELPEGDWLCSTGCKLIHHGLQDQLASGEVNLTESSMSNIMSKIKANGFATGAEINIKWRLLSGKMTSEETISMLSQAESIFHARFDPIQESRLGLPIDLIPHMVYGRDLTNRVLGGMYCAVLSVNSIVVCAGVFRTFGCEVAELPLVATKRGFDGLGYFQALFSCIEDLLTALNVKKIVLPAARKAISIWKNKFGFKEMAKNEIKQYRKQYAMMVFEGTILLHKRIRKRKMLARLDC